MRDDFKAALARVQSDYAFYIQCESDPARALADYSLSPEERATLSDPGRLADALKRGTEKRPRSITITISGSHDWVNRAAVQKRPKRDNEIDERIAREVESVKQADDDAERGDATLRLIQLLG